MTVGEVIAMLVTYGDDNASNLMSCGIYSIEVDDENSITVYPTDGSSTTLTIVRDKEKCDG